MKTTSLVVAAAMVAGFGLQNNANANAGLAARAAKPNLSTNSAKNVVRNLIQSNKKSGLGKVSQARVNTIATNLDSYIALAPTATLRAADRTAVLKVVQSKPRLANVATAATLVLKKVGERAAAKKVGAGDSLKEQVAQEMLLAVKNFERLPEFKRHQNANGEAIFTPRNKAEMDKLLGEIDFVELLANNGYSKVDMDKVATGLYGLVSSMVLLGGAYGANDLTPDHVARGLEIVKEFNRNMRSSADNPVSQGFQAVQKVLGEGKADKIGASCG